MRGCIGCCRYDSRRVPALPLNQERREQYLKTFQDLDLTGYPSNCLRKKKSSSSCLLLTSPYATTTGLGLDKDFSSESELGTLFSRFQSPQYFSSLKVISSKSLQVTQLPVEGVERLVEIASTSTVTSKSSISSGGTVVLRSRESSVSVRVDVFYHSLVIAEPWYHRWALVGNVACPSSIKPIAPDCK